MNLKYIKTLKKAYEVYNLNTEYEITKNILNYISLRIQENKDNIEKLIENQKLKIKYEDIFNTINQVKNSSNIYKSQVNIKKLNENFVSSTYQTSVGLIIVETSDILAVVKYFIEAIKSRNVIVISDKEYEEYGLKNYIMLIIKESIKKFDLDENLIDIYPYEETNYDLFDKVIIIDKDKKKVLSNKKETEELYVYIEDEYFFDVVDKDEKIVLLQGDLESNIERINESISKGAVIYTKNPNIAYKFINLVHSKNVFVNTSLSNIQNVEKSNNELFMNKYIIYELKKLI